MAESPTPAQTARIVRLLSGTSGTSSTTRRRAGPPTGRPMIHRCTALITLGRIDSMGVSLASAIDVLCSKWEDNHDPMDQHTGSVQAYDPERKATIMVEVRWPRWR